MKNSGHLFRRLMSSSDPEQLEDYLAEARYALVFAGLGFRVEIEPSGKKGPDLKVIRDGHDAVVEVTRFRKKFSGPPEFSLSDTIHTLSEYGDPERDTRKAIQKILDKFVQIGGAPAIIAVWNDDGEMEELEVKRAVSSIRDDVSRSILTIPAGALCVVYGSHWIGDRQFHCFPFRALEQPYHMSWLSELELSDVNSLIERALA